MELYNYESQIWWTCPNLVLYNNTLLIRNLGISYTGNKLMNFVNNITTCKVWGENVYKTWKVESRKDSCVATEVNHTFIRNLIFNKCFAHCAKKAFFVCCQSMVTSNPLHFVVLRHHRHGCFTSYNCILCLSIRKLYPKHHSHQIKLRSSTVV